MNKETPTTWNQIYFTAISLHQLEIDIENDFDYLHHYYLSWRKFVVLHSAQRGQVDSQKVDFLYLKE